jgi:hypothetical protein
LLLFVHVKITINYFLHHLNMKFELVKLGEGF